MMERAERSSSPSISTFTGLATEHHSPMLDHESPDKLTVLTIAATRAPASPPATNQFHLMGLTQFNCSGMSGCCAGWQRVPCNWISSQGLADFFPFVGEILCPVLLTLAHTQCFADRISSPAQHCQYMTSEHIKLSLGSSRKKSGFSFSWQSKTRIFRTF